MGGARLARTQRSNSLRKWRLIKGVTLKQLAQKTGLKDIYLVQLEKGFRKGTPNTWIKLAQELQLPVGHFFQEDILLTEIKETNRRVNDH